MAANSTIGDLISYCLSNSNTNVCEELCSQNPKLPICTGVPSYYNYRLNIVANAMFLVIFSISLIAYLAIYIATRCGIAFTVAMALGLVSEILGYSARIMSWQNQWSQTPFFMQICCLTFGPAFLAAGVYLCLRRIVFSFGQENSRIPPRWYTRIVCLSHGLCFCCIN
jgi:RTA1 like protein